MKTNVYRRDWLKRGVLTAAGVMAAPYLTYGAFPSQPISLDAKGNIPYTPFFKEYLPHAPQAPVELLAKLNANENPIGPSPMAIAAMQKYAVGGNRYAWKELYELMDKIAAYEGVKAESIMMGPGSSDLLEKTAMVFFKEGGNIISADPAYMSLIKVAEATGATWKPIKLKDDWSHDLAGMEAAIDSDTKLIYICNPNNPTGSITEHNELLDFCSRVSEKVPVFIDEAYLGFLGEGLKKSMVSLINEGKNVMIARTFSKIQGMAGLRVGYVVAQPETLEIIQSVTRGGMGITLPSVHAAMASMDDTAFSEKTIVLNKECREYVYKNLKRMGYDYVPSSTSFIIFPIEMDGKPFLEKMTAEGVGVRAFEIYGKNWCRVSMGTMDEMKLFTAALEKVLV
ncbi:pyridoxal phosphate-dependent aminotransferase [Maribacter spongiicola]|uniref:pyridoxal phosphate-dependent aminotransferase n=1 Tax=Maribacter spongiicola TaxID=1206753 RepID=UPI003F9DCA73